MALPALLALAAVVAPALRLLAAALLFWGGVQAAWATLFTVYTVVDSAVTATHGPWAMRQQVLPLDRVADVVQWRSLGDVIWGTGSLVVQGPASDENLVIADVRDPWAIRRAILGGGRPRD
jgi:hypothetical protein